MPPKGAGLPPLNPRAAVLPPPGCKRQAPKTFGQSRIYFCDQRFRLLPKIGDRVDIGFAYKKQNAKEVWNNLVERALKLNPKTNTPMA